MYDDLLLRLPDDEQDLWELLQAQFDHIAADFERLHLETREDALADRFHTRDYGVRRDGLNVIRYRDVSKKLDSRPYFWDMGRELVDQVEHLISAKRLTPVFVQQWGKLTFCHGYIMAHVFDDSDDLAHQRAGKKGAAGRSKDMQRRWVGHLMCRLIQAGRRRNAVEDVVVTYIRKVIADPTLRGDFEASWFEGILDDDQAQLKTTYDEQRLTKKAIFEIGQGESDGLPPLPAKLPLSS